MSVSDAVLAVDGFDDNTALQGIYSEQGLTSAAPAIETSAKRTGVRGLRISQTGSFKTSRVRVIPPELSGGKTTVILGFAFRQPVGSGGTAGVVSLLDSGTIHLSVVRIDSDNSFRLRFGTTAGTQLAASAAGVCPLGEYMYLEVIATIADSGGSFTLRKNGAVIMTFSGDTRNGATAKVNSWEWGQDSNVSGGTDTPSINIDDWYIMDGTHVDATPLGDCAVVSQLVTGAGDDADFTPSAGIHYQNVDEQPPDGDTTYNQSNTVGHRDTFGIAPIGTLGTIIGVQYVVEARKLDAGARTLSGVVKLGASELTPGPFTLGTTFVKFREWMPAQPGGGSWVAGSPGIDDALIGYEVAS